VISACPGILEHIDSAGARGASSVVVSPWLGYPPPI